MKSPDEKPKLRVSDWSVDEPTAQVSPPAPSPAPAPATPEPAAADGGLDLPVDPLRLLGGLWQRRRLIVIATLLAAIAGTAFGLWRTKTRFQVSAQLITREIPNTFRAGEIGEAFKPRELSSATLIGIAGSANVLSRVAERADPPIGLSELRRSIEVAEQRGTDYLYLTLSGYASAQATVDLANIWAEEVVAYTRDMQSRESREIRQYLQQELDANAAELDRVSRGLLDYNRKEGLVNIDKQIDAQLRSIGDLDLRYESSRLEIESINIKLRSLETELARQSPLAEDLKVAGAALAEARTRYTDTNPIVLEALQRVDDLEARLQADRASDSTDLSRFAGTFLGNTLYLQILDLSSQREALSSSLAELTTLRDAAREQLNSLPGKELGIAQLTRNRRSLENTRDLLLSRLPEAEVFEQRAPGYYQIFTPASVDAVITSAKPLKVAVYGIAGLVAGCGAALLLALGLELLDSRLRTGAEAAKAWATPLLASFPAGLQVLTPAGEQLIRRLWNRWQGKAAATSGPMPLWIPVADASEDDLWRGLLNEATRLCPNLVIVDTGDPAASPPALASLPIVTLERATAEASAPRRTILPAQSLSLADTESLATHLRDLARQGCPVWIRLTGDVREPLTTLVQRTGRPLIIVATGAASIPDWREHAASLRAASVTPCGVVALAEVSWHDR